MKALIWKEFREQRVLTVFAALVMVVMLIRAGWISVSSALSESMGKGGVIQMLQPLMAEDFHLSVAVICGLFATILGWMQMFNERHRDLHAYLLHRPLSPQTIFRAKVTTGMALYFLAMGLPLLVFILWVSFSGRVAAPFEWSMVLPSLAYFLSGTVCYFIAMLVCVRRAKWQGSRIWPMGVGILLYASCAVLPLFWMVGLVIAISIGLTALAAAGAFAANGEYESQSPLEKAALTGSLTVGATIICLFFGVVIHNTFENRNDRSSFRYQIGRDGTVYKISMRGNVQEVTDLEGKPLIDANGQKITFLRHPYGLATYGSLSLYRDDDFKNRKPAFQSSFTYYRYWKSGEGIIWYDWLRYGRLVGFDGKTGKIVGSIGPEGFAEGLAGKSRFAVPDDNYWYPRSTLVDEQTAYAIDEREMTAKPLLRVSDTNQILEARVIQTGEGPRYTAVATRSSLHFFTPDGKQLWQIPLTKDPREYSQIGVHLLDVAGKFAVTVKPSYKLNEERGGKMPTYYFLVASGGTIEKQMEVPADFYGKESVSLLEKITMGSMPLCMHLLVESDHPFVAAALVYSTVAMIIGIILGRRHRMSLKAQSAWAVFHFVTGVGGLLAFIFTRNWPLLVKCPSCQKLRQVEHTHCEHCQAPFPAPERNGVEIFETATAE
ncbi:MAG TPA: ABC transporter permease [Verrucomicrobiae bacterium]